MKRHLLVALALLLHFTPASAQPAAPPPGTWGQLPNTTLYPAIPVEAKPESAPGGRPELWNPAAVFAYSGGDLATINGVRGFLYWGGGHAGTYDNSTYFVPFDGSGPRRLSGPYLAPDFQYFYDIPKETYRSVSRNAPASVTAPGAPKSRHTYSSLLTIEVNGKPYLWCYGGSLATGGGSGSGATRMFDLSLSYAQAMARPDMGWALKAPAPAWAVTSSSGWDPVQKRVVTRGSQFIGAYYPEEDRWENWNIYGFPGGSDFHASAAVDVVGRKMYVLGDRIAEVIDLDTKVWTNLIAQPWAAIFKAQNDPIGPGVVWHARTKQLVIWRGGQHLLLINPATGVTTTVPMGGATVTAAEGSGTFGRFRLIPGTDQVVLVNAVTQNVFIGTIAFPGDSPSPFRPTR